MRHVTVLLQETVDAIAPQSGGVYVDGTLGNGGHIAGLAQAATGPITVIGIDADSEAIARATNRLSEFNNLTFKPVQSYNDRLAEIVDAAGVACVQGVVLDLGMSSDQLETSGRGFSFQKDEPLLMTMQTSPTTQSLTAASLVENADLDGLTTIIRNYSDERYARRIAQAIVREREQQPITTTQQLQEIIAAAVPARYRHGKINPATKTFQALRIAVNDEMSRLHTTLDAAGRTLCSGGRLAVITFHSIEDRIVKHWMRQAATAGLGIVLTKKPIYPTDDEIATNPRARSAKLRIFEKA